MMTSRKHNQCTDRIEESHECVSLRRADDQIAHLTT